MEACSEGDVNTVRRLLFEGHNANETTEEGESLLALACAAGYYELVEVKFSLLFYFLFFRIYIILLFITHSTSLKN